MDGGHMDENTEGGADHWMTLRAYAKHKAVRLSAVQKAISSGRIRPDALKVDSRGRYVGIEQVRADRYWALNTDPLEAARNGKFHNAPPAAGSQSSAAQGSARTGDVSANTGNEIPRREGDRPAAEPGLPAVASAVGAGPAAVQAPRIPSSSPEVDGLASVAAPGVAGSEGRADLLDVGTKNGDNDSFQQARTRKLQFEAKSAEVSYLQTIGRLVEAAAVQREVAEIFIQLKTSVMRIPERKAQILAAETDPARVHRILSEELRSVLDECSRHFADDAAGGTEEPAAACT